MTTSGPTRSATETRARIIATAQQLFATKGYSHAGLREIGQQAGVSPSLILKYFGSKPQLFEAALGAAIIPLSNYLDDRSSVGEAIVDSVINRDIELMAPAMIALSLGDASSREIAARVVRQQIIDPVGDWLEAGTPDDKTSRAVSIFLMTTGFALGTRNMELGLDEATRSRTNKWFAAQLQGLVDHPQEN